MVYFPSGAESQSRSSPMRWLSNHDLSELTVVSLRTISNTTRNFHVLGVVDLYPNLDSYRFQLLATSERLLVNATLEEAASVFAASPLAEKP